jgi:biotin-(acetyl-CoA carboxylase) ligase
MIIFSDSVEYADILFSNLGEWNSGKATGLDPDKIPEQLFKGLYGDKKVLKTSKESKTCWQYAFLVENASASHYDLLLELSREGAVLPDRILCLAGSGDKFHGQRNRSWAAVPGNIHLTAVFKPERKINNFQACFPALAAVSVVEAIDGIKGFSGRAGIKWVNDVVIDEAKTAGFIAHSQCLEGLIQTAFLGIGLNVETTPKVESSRFVPEVGSLGDFCDRVDTCRQSDVLQRLLIALDRNYEAMLRGEWKAIIEVYRQRSLVLGREVAIFSDPVNKKQKKIYAGRVIGIGNNLELYLEGQEKPVYAGRLVFKKMKPS